MKNIVIAAALSGALGGVVATVATKQMGSTEPKGSEVAEEAALTPGAASQDEALLAQLETLQRQNDEMALRLAALESRRDSRREEIAEEGDGMGDIQAQLAELAAALENPQSAQSAGLRNMVATAMDEVREQEAEDRRIEREQRDVERIQERVEEYAQELGLDAVQKQGMQNALIDESKARNELFTQMREGTMPREDMREAFTSIREGTQATLGNVLTPMQLEDYNEMAGDRGGRWGGGGGRGGGGGGGRGRGN